MKFDIKDLLMMTSPMYLLMKLIDKKQESPKDTTVASNNDRQLDGLPK